MYGMGMGTQLPAASWLDEPIDLPEPRPRVLVADDDPSLVRLLRELLEMDGYDVECAYDGQQAIHLARCFHYDLIILDINMPMTNGYRVLEYLRTHPDTTKVPVIIVTGEPSRDVYPKVAGDPRAAYIKKPLEIESLSSVVKHYLKR